ncbi:Uncharacterised protein [Paucimonas lemoignei]|nr:Uncharacterised protein [Paucimonas lemoignei]
MKTKMKNDNSTPVTQWILDEINSADGYVLPKKIRAREKTAIKSVSVSSYFLKLERSYYDQAFLDTLVFTRRINELIDKRKAFNSKQLNDSNQSPYEFSDAQLEEIRKESYLLAPFINSKKTSIGINGDLNGLLVSMQNKINSLSIIASGDKKLTFTYVVKKGKGNSMSIDGFIDLNENDDNINFVGLRKLLSIYSGE